MLNHPTGLFSGDYNSALRGCWPIKFFHTLQLPKMYFKSYLGRRAASCWALPHISSCVCICVQGGPKMAQFVLNTLLCQILTYFQSSFTVRIRRKFVITSSLKIPRNHTSCVSLHYVVKCQKFMVSVGVSRMGKTGIVFVEPGANSEYILVIVQ